MKNLVALIGLMLATTLAGAAEESFKQFGNIKVHYSAFSSDFIEPEIASVYNITRGVDKGLVNIAVVTNDQAGGDDAEVSGSVSNIFAQEQKLEFFEVREADAVYYLAPFEFDNEDFLTFSIQVETETGGPYNLKFQRTFYHDK